MEKPDSKKNENSVENWELFFELYEILMERVEAREERMRDSLRKVGTNSAGNNKKYKPSVNGKK